MLCRLLVVTAYDDSSGAPPWGVTASMTRTRPGVAAYGPSWPFGTVVALPGRTVVCEDRGGGIGDREVDLWMPTRRGALERGRRGERAIIFIMEGLPPGKRAAAASNHARWRGNVVAEAVPGTRPRSIPE